MPYPAYDHFLTRKARACWRAAVVTRESDGSFLLNKRTGDAPVLLSAPVENRGPFATFHAARRRLYELRDAHRTSATGRGAR